MMEKNQIFSGALNPMRPEVTPENRMALAMWNTMGGIDWHALPLLVSLYDVQDPEGLLNRLVTIRDFMNG